jgi:hypothetical protein
MSRNIRFKEQWNLGAKKLRNRNIKESRNLGIYVANSRRIKISRYLGIKKEDITKSKSQEINK